MTSSTCEVAVCCSSDSESSRVRCLLRFEQAHVLDCDDGLVGEGFQQLDVLDRERSGRGTSDGDRSDGVRLVKHRYDQNASIAQGAGQKEGRRENCRVVLKVPHLNDGAVEDRGGHLGLPARSPRVHGAKRLKRFVRPVVVRNEVNQVAVEFIHGTEEAVAKLDDVLRDRVKDLLDARRRTTDHAEKFARSHLMVERLAKFVLGLRKLSGQLLNLALQVAVTIGRRSGHDHTCLHKRLPVYESDALGDSRSRAAKSRELASAIG